MILPMYIFGQPVLRKVATEINPKEYEGLQELIQNMYETNRKWRRDLRLRGRLLERAGHTREREAT